MAGRVAARGRAGGGGDSEERRDAMNVHGLLLLGILLSSFVTGLVIFFLKEENHRLRTWLNLLGAGVKLILVAALLWGLCQGQTYSFALEFLPGIPFALG